MVRYLRHTYLLPLLLVTLAWALPIIPPHLKTSWAGLTGGNAAVNIVLPVLDSSITVTDELGSTYAIQQFRFSYRQKTQYQDSAGQVKDNYVLVSKVFYKSNQLDSLWKDNIKSSVHAGDSFTIDNVVAKDRGGKKVLAPSIDIQVTGEQ